MNDAAPVYVAQSAGATATVYRLAGWELEFRIRVEIPGLAILDYQPNQLPAARKVMEQAELFLHHEEQLARMNRCPGCGG